MIVSDRLAEPFLKDTNWFAHGITFGGHPVAAAVAMANLDIFEREDLTGHVRKNSPVFRSYLEKLKDLPIVGDVRGDGYFFGIEMVKDKATKETFDDDESERLLRGFLSKALFDAGLYCRADDRGDPVIQLAPPLICDETPLRGDRADPPRRADRSLDARSNFDGDRRIAPCRLWMSTVDDDLTPRPPLGGDIDVDVAIVGAGFTGLWTAYYLAVADPTLRIAVVEAGDRGVRRVRPQRRLVLGAVPAVGARRWPPARPRPGDRDAPGHAAPRSTRSAGPRPPRASTATSRKGGTVVLARSPLQLERARAEVAESASTVSA